MCLRCGLGSVAEVAVDWCAAMCSKPIGKRILWGTRACPVRKRIGVHLFLCTLFLCECVCVDVGLLVVFTIRRAHGVRFVSRLYVARGLVEFV